MVVFVVLLVIIFIAALILMVCFKKEKQEESSNEAFESAKKWDLDKLDDFFDILIDSLELGIDFDTCIKCHDYFRNHISLGSSYGWTSKQANDCMFKAMNELTPNLWRAYGKLQNNKLSQEYNNPNHYKTDKTRIDEANSIGVSFSRLVKYEHLADKLRISGDKFGKNSNEYEVVLKYVFNIVDDKNLFDKYLFSQNM